jgi:hypothetical protein
MVGEDMAALMRAVGIASWYQAPGGKGKVVVTNVREVQ